MKLHAEVVTVLALPEISDEIKSIGAEPVGNPPEEFAAQLRGDIVKWSKVAREANIRAQ